MFRNIVMALWSTLCAYFSLVLVAEGGLSLLLYAIGAWLFGLFIVWFAWLMVSSALEAYRS